MANLKSKILQRL